MIEFVSFMLIDSHCHLVHPSYGKTPSDLVSEALNDGVDKLITIGTSLNENKIAIRTAAQFSNVFSSIGIYPHEDREISLDDLRKGLEEQVASPKVVAIGECGIDISNGENGRPLGEQLELFSMQVDFASSHGLPLIIHNRNGDTEILDVLQQYRGNIKGVVHCFSSTWDVAQKFFDLGFLISFSGMITYPSRKELQDVVKKAPLDKFLVETDAPYLPPQGRRGQTNEPKYVKIVAEKVSELKQIPFADICTATHTNTSKLFGI